MKITSALLGALLLAAGVPAGAADPVATVATPEPKAAPISQDDLLAKLDAKDPDLVVLDVRTPAEFAAGHVPGARNVPHEELPARLAELAAQRDKPVVLYCRSGRRSQIAAEVLGKAGFTQLRHLEGDWLAWEAQKRPVEK